MGKCIVDGCDGTEPAYAFGICGPCLHAFADAYDNDGEEA
jgi:hypothetical protein